MAFSVDLFWSFRSPCSYLAISRTLRLVADYDVAVGVPTFVFEGERFFGQDRIDLLTWRMESKGLRPRGRS